MIQVTIPMIQVTIPVIQVTIPVIQVTIPVIQVTIPVIRSDDSGNPGNETGIFPEYSFPMLSNSLFPQPRIN